MHYCEASQLNSFHQQYHDFEYGFAKSADHELFELLCLEINQAGLAWLTVLKKRANFKQAFDDFEIAKVAAYDDSHYQQLLNNPGIIRNRLKIQAVIHNATVLERMIEHQGSFKAVLDDQLLHHQTNLQAWVRWFKQHFRFVGIEIVNEFLTSSGYLPGAHQPHCPVYQQVLESQPAWLAYQASQH